MTTYEIKKVAENQWGLFDTDKPSPEDLLVLSARKSLLKLMKRDFIWDDKEIKKRIREEVRKIREEERRRKNWKRRVEHG